MASVFKKKREGLETENKREVNEIKEAEIGVNNG